MNQSDRAEFGKLLCDVHAFYKQDASPFVLEVWWQACQRFDMEQIRKAMSAHLMNAERGQFPPKPADIIRFLEGTPTDRALMAWGKLLHAMQAVGAYTDAVFDDPAIHATVEDMGGWIKICRSETKDLGYMQHRFCDTYRAYVARGHFPYQRVLSGDRSPDDVYAMRGLPPPKPAIIGDRQKAKLVYEGGQTGGKVGISFGSFGGELEKGLSLIFEQTEDDYNQRKCANG